MEGLAPARAPPAPPPALAPAHAGAVIAAAGAGAPGLAAGGAAAVAAAAVVAAGGTPGLRVAQARGGGRVGQAGREGASAGALTRVVIGGGVACRRSLTTITRSSSSSVGDLGTTPMALERPAGQTLTPPWGVLGALHSPTLMAHHRSSSSIRGLLGRRLGAGKLFLPPLHHLLPLPPQPRQLLRSSLQPLVTQLPLGVLVVWMRLLLCPRPLPPPPPPPLPPLSSMRPLHPPSPPHSSLSTSSSSTTSTSTTSTLVAGVPAPVVAQGPTPIARLSYGGGRRAAGPQWAQLRAFFSVLGA